MSKRFYIPMLTIVLLFGAGQARGTIVAYWAFPNTVPASAENFKIIFPIAANEKANAGAAEISTDGLTWDGTQTGATAHQQGNFQYLTGPAGSTIIQPPYTSGADLSVRSTLADPSNDKSITFRLDTTGFTGLSMQYDERYTTNGAAAIAISWSTDGTNFTPTSLGYNTVRNSTYSLRTIDLSSLTALENTSAAYVRFTFSGYASNGTSRYDNITFLGVPEPATIGLLAFGMVVVAKRRR